MIRAEQIPDAAIQAMMQSEEWSSFFSRSDAKKLVAACLNAWPRMRKHRIQVPDDSDEIRYILKTVGIILPLPQENADE